MMMIKALLALSALASVLCAPLPPLQVPVDAVSDAVSDAVQAGQVALDAAVIAGGNILGDAPQILAQTPKLVQGALAIAGGAAALSMGNPLGGLGVAQGSVALAQGAAGVGAVVVPDVARAVVAASDRARAGKPAEKGSLDAALPRLAADAAAAAKAVAAATNGDAAAPAKAVAASADAVAVLLPVAANAVRKVTDQYPNAPLPIQHAPQVIDDAAHVAAGVSDIAGGDVAGGLLSIGAGVTDAGKVVAGDVAAAVKEIAQAASNAADAAHKVAVHVADTVAKANAARPPKTAIQR